MSVDSRLTEVFNNAQEITFDDTSRIIFFSDCHRGDNSWADEFAKNENAYSFALEHYFKEGFTYIELGDGDELYDNKYFPDIRAGHSRTFEQMRAFFQAGRFHMVYGNHDMERADPQIVKETLYKYIDERTGQKKPLFLGIEPREGLILRHIPSGGSIFLAHGFQGDTMCDQFSNLTRFVDRHFWAPLRKFGLDNPTGTAKSYQRHAGQEARMVDWVRQWNQPAIFGHTHRPVFAEAGQAPYFNDGCCIHPRDITGIEIDQGEIQLIEWSVLADDDGLLRVCREVMKGPRKVAELFV